MEHSRTFSVVWLTCIHDSTSWNWAWCIEIPLKKLLTCRWTAASTSCLAHNSNQHLKKALTLWCVAECQWRRGQVMVCPALSAISCIDHLVWGGGTQPCPGCRDRAPPASKGSAPRGHQRLKCSPRGTDLRRGEKQKDCRRQNTKLYQESLKIQGTWV